MNQLLIQGIPQSNTQLGWLYSLRKPPMAAKDPDGRQACGIHDVAQAGMKQALFYGR